MTRNRDLVYLLGGAYLLLRRDDVDTALNHTVLIWPVVVRSGANRLAGRGGSRITQEFRPGIHAGVDIAVPGEYTTATADVVAVSAGRVVQAWQAPRGWAVLLDHGDWASGYLHLAELDAAIRDGEPVRAGQRLGPMGADPLDPEHIVHLHLQLAPGGHVVDPAPFLAKAV